MVNTDLQREKFMLLKFAARLLRSQKPIPECYQRMVRSEFRSVKMEYVEMFYDKHDRLPTMEELQHAS